MLLRGRSHPRAVHWARGVSCGGCNELVRCRTERTIRTKGNSLEANVEALLLDDLVRAAILSGVGVGDGAIVLGLGGPARARRRSACSKAGKLSHRSQFASAAVTTFHRIDWK